MASVTKNDDGKNAMADDLDATGASAGEPEKTLDKRVDYKSPSTVVANGPGFFTIYKSGQGYWTRMGTVAGAALIAILTAGFLYEQSGVWFQDAAGHSRKGVVLGVVVGFLAIYSFFVYRIINKPKVADFLIATDSEMKKVNWTTRRELIGSTKVVIVFMVLIALILFGFDTFFGYFFWLIGVLQINPFTGG